MPAAPSASRWTSSRPSGAPTTVNIPNQSILRGGQPTRLNLASLFQREDLIYTATSSRENFATVEIDQVTQELVITTLRAGVTVITVTATDVNRGKATDTFRLTVVSPNKPPEVVGNVPDQTLFLDDAGTQLDMTPYFRDGDGDLLRFIRTIVQPQGGDGIFVRRRHNFQRHQPWRSKDDGAR